MLSGGKNGVQSQFGKFIIVGAFSTIVNYGIFYLMFNFLHVHYLVASGTGYISGVLFGFYFNKSWSFNFYRQSKIALLKYVSVYFFSLIVSIFFLNILVEFFLLDERIANILVIGLTTCLNFLCIKFFVFK